MRTTFVTRIDADPNELPTENSFNLIAKWYNLLDVFRDGA